MLEKLEFAGVFIEKKLLRQVFNNLYKELAGHMTTSEKGKRL